MQLNNVKKKVEKAAQKLGLGDGEQVLAACTTNPKGTMNRMLARELGGALAAAATARGGSGSSEAPDGDEGQADRFPAGQQYLVLTDRRLLTCSVSAMTGKPKEATAEWSISEIAGIATERAKLAIPMSIAFADGSAVTIEAARGTGGDTLPEVFATLAGAAG